MITRFTVAALVLATAVVAFPAASTAAPPSPSTPNACITVNGGDWNACNVGNSGRGDLPYHPPAGYSPSQCISRNGGDWIACSVGNRGVDLTY
jgi:roadblock/LC7 domain-containing protein